MRTRGGQAVETAVFAETLMCAPVITCRPHDTLNTAAHLMWQHDCGSLPVVDDEGAIVGMVTDRDVCMCAYTQGRDLHALRVADAMSREVRRCDATDSLAHVAELMRKHQVRRIPVMLDARLVGIVSLGDLATAAGAASRARVRGRLAPKDVGELLAAVCRPPASPISAAPGEPPETLPAP